GTSRTYRRKFLRSPELYSASAYVLSPSGAGGVLRSHRCPNTATRTVTLPSTNPMLIDKKLSNSKDPSSTCRCCLESFCTAADTYRVRSYTPTRCAEHLFRGILIRIRKRKRRNYQKPGGTICSVL